MAGEPEGAALVAEFDAPAALLAATRRLSEAGYAQLEAYSPVYLEGLAEALPQPPPRRIPAYTLAAALLGAGLMFGFQAWAMAVDWRLNVGGRAPFSWPAFIVPSFEMLILFGALTAFGAALARSDLPRPHHPIFDLAAFERASDDRFFLAVGADDPRFDRARTHELLAELDPVEVHALHC